MRKLSQTEAINQAKAAHPNKNYDYSKAIYQGMTTNWIVICGEHGEWSCTPKNHIRHQTGCPNCAGNVQKDTELFIKQAKKIHAEGKDSYDKVKYKTNAEKITITCNTHGDYEQVPVEHLSGKRCRGCANDKMRKEEKVFIQEATVLHNGKYTYDKVKYYNWQTKVDIDCPIHGTFPQTPNAHLGGDGCPKCGRIAVKVSKEEFLNRSQTSHIGDEYDYSQIDWDKVLANDVFEKVEILCSKHGSFWQAAHHHMEGDGCPTCAREAEMMPYPEFKDKGNKKHNGRYTYNDSNYKNAAHKTWIGCKKHGLFYQDGRSHLRGCGCPKCSDNVSKPEIAWLDDLGIPEEYRQKRLTIDGKLIIPDAYDPNTNTCFLFHGTFWHGHPDHFASEKINPVNKKAYGELYANTLKQEELLIKAGYNLVVMWEHNYKTAINEQTIERPQLI